VVNVIAMTGVGNTLSLMIQQWAGGSLLIALVLVALASLILGMGLPVTAAYVVLATLSAPALYNLMAESQVVSLIASGTPLPEASQALVMLAAPDQLSLIGHPMPIESARSVIEALRAVDPSLVVGLYDPMLSPQLLLGLLLSAHMIIFWLSQDSNVTPPVCLTAFAAAAIAGSSQLRTGLTAWKLAKGLYIMPLLFAHTSFLYGDWLTVLEIFLFTLAGLYGLALALQGQPPSRFPGLSRSLAALAAVALIIPVDTWVHAVGLGLLTIVLLWNRRQSSSVIETV